ncbi:MAG: glycosyltransferase family 39 protein [Planctomycetes bacterium]|nr:glycosyltransferase family 39 protein [Planctomycetota bacterium]
MTERRWLVALLVLAAALRLFAVFDYEARHPHADAPVIDEASYDRWAREIAAGDWIGDEVFFQEPLYPYALGTVYSLTDGSRTAARLVQVGLGVLSVLLVWMLARRVFGERAGWIAGALFALHPVAILMPCLLLKPNLFVPILAALCLALAGDRDAAPKRWIAIGVLGGLGALLRGNLLILLPVLALWPFLRDRSLHAWKPAASFALGAALVLAPVMIRNLAVGGVFALTTSGAGTNLYGGNALENPYGVATEFPWVRGVPEHEALDWRLEAERRSGRELDAGETSRFWIRELGHSIAERPEDHAAILWNKQRLTLGAYEVADNHFVDWDARYVRVLGLPLPGWGFSGVFGLAGLLAWIVLRREVDADARRGGDLLALAFVAYLATIVLTVTSMRARFPLLVMLLPFAGYFADRALRVRRAEGVARYLLLLGVLVAADVVVHADVFDAGQRSRDLAERDHNLGAELLESGRAAEAAPIAARLSDEYPHSARLAILDCAVRAEVVFDELAAGAPRDPRHVDALQDCLARLQAVFEDEAVSPRERARAAGVAGRIQDGLGQTARAERQLRRAREFMRADVDLLATHARLLHELSTSAGEPSPELDAVRASVLEDLQRYGDPDGWAPRLSAAPRSR